MNPVDVVLDSIRTKERTVSETNSRDLLKEWKSGEDRFGNLILNFSGVTVTAVMDDRAEKEIKKEYSKNLLETLITSFLLIHEDNCVEYVEIVRDKFGLSSRNRLTGKITNSFFNPSLHKIFYTTRYFNGKKKVILKIGRSAKFVVG